MAIVLLIWAVIVFAVLGLIIFLLIRRPLIGRIILFILICLIVFGISQWKPIYETRLPLFAEDVKKTVDPIVLQQWAVTTLQNTNLSASFFLPTNSIPVKILNLSSQGSPFEVANCDYSTITNQGCVWLTWGGGFGPWGIRVGSSSFKVIPDNRNYYIEWKPGIYFFHETH